MSIILVLFDRPVEQYDVHLWPAAHDPIVGIVSAASDIRGPGVYFSGTADSTATEMIEMVGIADKVHYRYSGVDEFAQLTLKTLEKYTSNDDTLYPSVASSEMLFIGCSHTYGVGHRSKSTVYTHRLSNMLGYTPNVVAFPGEGNWQIEDQLSSMALRDSKVIVQFTDYYRVQVFDDSRGEVVKLVGKNMTRRQLEMFTEGFLKYEFYRTVNRVVSRLRDANSKFLIFVLSHETDGNRGMYYELARYKEFCWMPDAVVDVADDRKHFGHNSHANIASMLKNKWDRLYGN